MGEEGRAGKWEEVALSRKLHNGWEGLPNKTETRRKLYSMKKQSQILSVGKARNRVHCLDDFKSPASSTTFGAYLLLMAQIYW
ncbi:hypothetical protein CapIbe_008251 [Capra ibex]